jgi:hypothetical protein
MNLGIGDSKSNSLYQYISPRQFMVSVILSTTRWHCWDVSSTLARAHLVVSIDEQVDCGWPCFPFFGCNFCWTPIFNIAHNQRRSEEVYRQSFEMSFRACCLAGPEPAYAILVGSIWGLYSTFNFLERSFATASTNFGLTSMVRPLFANG